MSTDIVNTKIRILANCCNLPAYMITGIVSTKIQILKNCSHLSADMTTGIANTTIQILTNCCNLPLDMTTDIMSAKIRVLTNCSHLPADITTDMWVLQYRHCRIAVSCLRRCVQTFWQLSADSTLFPSSWRHYCRYFEWRQEMLAFRSLTDVVKLRVGWVLTDDIGPVPKVLYRENVRSLRVLFSSVSISLGRQTL